MSDNETLQDDITPAGAPYVKNADRATDYRSTGLLLTVFGGAGIIFVILTFLGVIPGFFGNPYLTYGVLFAIFVLFFVMGVISVRSAGIFEKRSKSDNSLELRILDYVSSELTPEGLDRESDVREGDGPEVMFFKRTECLKTLIVNKFININPEFLDNLIDEKLYDLIYGEKDLTEQG